MFISKTSMDIKFIDTQFSKVYDVGGFNLGPDAFSEGYRSWQELSGGRRLMAEMSSSEDLGAAFVCVLACLIRPCNLPPRYGGRGVMATHNLIDAAMLNEEDRRLPHWEQEMKRWTDKQPSPPGFISGHLVFRALVQRAAAESQGALVQREASESQPGGGPGACKDPLHPDFHEGHARRQQQGHPLAEEIFNIQKQIFSTTLLLGCGLRRSGAGLLVVPKLVEKALSMLHGHK